ncbi:hypothetical protein RN001_007114 [Aquatica leii]|uniref:Uncharacterized protein n=1 Tax=Aquatica leii TaxID=1421715 RepID=A0AAN7SNR4_9COLE|nr:hypothetical protein RN001_007114 [Aquatica leii]
MPQHTKKHSQISKWMDKSYSRQQRQPRKFEVYDARQPKITEYFNILKSMQECLQENRALRMEISREICRNMEESEKSEKQIDKLLVMLQDTALRNLEKNKHGKIFSEPLKLFCLHFYIISGRLAYETLYRKITSSLPSLSTIHRTLDEGERVEEGAIRMSQLKQFLIQRKLPLKIFVSEDQTAVIQTIQYEPKINEMVGFVCPLNPETGFPERRGFVVNTLTDIERAFIEENVSKNAYVFMGQALKDSAPPFCICVYGSDNKISAEDVLNRWQYLKKQTSLHDIEIVEFSSDRDTRCLKAMKEASNFPVSVNTINNDCPYKPYFQILLSLGEDNPNHNDLRSEADNLEEILLEEISDTEIRNIKTDLNLLSGFDSLNFKDYGDENLKKN